MNSQRLSDEILVAYVDGELDADGSKNVEEALQNGDADVIARVEMFMQSRALVKEAFATLAKEPLPDALQARVLDMVKRHDEEAAEQSGQDEQGDKTPEGADAVVPFKTKEPAQATGTSILPPWVMPVAATGAFLVIGLGGYIAGGGGQSSPKSGLSVARLDQPGILEALKSVPSGKSVLIGNQGDRFAAIASYRDTSNAFCREFEVDRSDSSSVVAVACVVGEAWEIHFSVLAAQTGEGYAPASSLEALDAYLVAVEASPPLSLEEEAIVLSAFH